ncbi:MAG: hypothetical protein KA792_06100, partial [Bacteroidales bacterium]|nr:hypothetical protein [Bacteroidales bacterium]
TYEASMLWGKYNTDWTYPTVGTRTTAGAGGSIEVTGLASFSDYTGMGCTPPSIDNHPSNANKCNGEPASFSVVASGTSPTYQWQINDGSWTNLTNTGVYSNVTEATMNISDVTGLDGKEYHCVVTACSSEETSNTATLTVTSCSGTATWVGGNAGNETKWDIAANWNINQIPGIDNDVIIPTNPAGGAYFPVISSIAVCKNMQIDPKASLTINGGNSLTINGNLTIKSSNTGTGAILDLGTLTITGNVTVERFITGISGYHYICSPINGATFNQINDNVTLSYLGYGYYNPSNPPTTSNMPNIWWYDETHSTPANDAMEAWKTPSATGDAMDEMRGYALNITAGTVVDFITTGANLNTGNKQINLTKTSAPGGFGGNGGNGYHIVGNPYPSPIDWNLIQPGLGLNANSTYALFRPTSQWGGGFGYYNPTSGPSGSFFPTRYIAPVQGFYVQAYNNFLMTLNNTVRSVSTEAMNSLFYKKNDNTASKEAKILKLKATNLNAQNAADVAILYFVKDATTGIDNLYDAGKLMNTDPELPNLYTVYNNDNLANNALPEVYDGLKVALVMNVQQKGKYSIEAIDIINFDAGIEIYLDDILTGKSINLTQNPNYRFNASPYENNRFFIRFTVNNSGINTLTSQNNKVNVYAVNSNIYVNADNSLINKAYISICNLLGQELFSSKITKDLNKIELNAGNTYYLVRVISDNYTYTQKVFIK